MVNVLINYRASGPWGGQQMEFREGDRAWPGASIMELPDLSSVHLEARLEEADRGRLRIGQEAAVRIEAIPGREFKATIERISVLAKVDYSAGWPPTRNFELGLVLAEIDPKIRPGMSAVARIATDLVPDVLLAPAEAIFQKDGHPIVYKLEGGEFAARQVQVARRGKELAIIESGLAPGDRVATRKPAAEMIVRKK
jgi:multidrug efflux pump subunit AcrA (membrane-fusion protein)